MSKNAFRALKALAVAGAALIVASPAMAQISVLRDAEIEEFIDDYSRPIFTAAGLPADGINIWLIGDPTPNAFAGGLNMGIHTGLITAADTPNQIEGVIAHEAGHIAGGHTARSDEALTGATRPMLLSLLLAAGAVAAGAPDAGLAVLGLGQTVGVANALKYSRGQEAAADQAALTYLESVGRSGEGLIEFFAKLRNFQTISGYRVNPYLQSHPLANQRITALTERATAAEHFEAKDSEEEIFRLRMIQAKIYGFLEAAHFTLRRYPVSDQSDPAHYARAVAYYLSADIDKALGEIDTLIAKYPDNQYFHELKGQMLFEFGRTDDAIAPHRRSVELEPDEALFRINLGRALLGQEDPLQAKDAVTEFKVAVTIEPDNAFAWHEMARAYGVMQDEPRALLATAESRYYGGNPMEAAQFARRAIEKLEKDTPEHAQALDVLNAAETQSEQRGRGRRGLNEFAPSETLAETLAAPGLIQ